MGSAGNLQPTSDTGIFTKNTGFEATSPDLHTSDRSAVLICPIGGLGRIGMNLCFYGFAGKTIMVDCGSAFLKKDGATKSIMPDPASFKMLIDRMDALVVTHAHEDHIGAIHHLWGEIRKPIYATPFAARMIRGRLQEKGLHDIEIREFAPGSSFTVGSVEIETVPITHSTVECVGLALKTPVGTVFHTGDWKLDPDPLVGKPTDLATLERLGSEGIMAVLSDSTNAEREDGTSSEATIAANIEHVMRTRKGAIVISCFATNIARLAGIGLAAKKTGRKVALAGRSLIRAEEIARELGLISKDYPFLDNVRHLGGLDQREIVIVCTGTQGEERAGLSRLALQESRYLPDISAGDTVIYSARMIPGNEHLVEPILNRFRARHVEVLVGADGDLPLHATGHAARPELRTLYQMMQPRFAIPVHGAKSHMEAHAKLAIESGAGEAILLAEGDIVSVTPEAITRKGSIAVQHLAIGENGDHVRMASETAIANQPEPLGAAA